MPTCDFWRVILLLTAGGGIGGLLYWTSIYLSSIKPNSDVPASGAWTGNFWYCLANVFTGIGGAWAAMLAMLWASRAPLGNTTQDLLELLATYVLAGYAGNRILPAAAERLTSELLKQTAANAKADAQSAKSDAESARRSRLVAEILAYLDNSGNQTDHQTDDYIQLLKAEIASDALFRPGTILLARIYAEQKKDLVAAISVLEGFIEAKKKTGATDDSDIADAYWNLANYYELQFKANDSNRSLRLKAISCLGESLRIIPAYMSSLKQDPDFKELVGDSAAQSLLESN